MKGKINKLSENAARLFAADCAERVLSICGDDDTPKKAVQAARDYVSGKIAENALYSAWKSVSDLAFLNRKKYLWSILRGDKEGGYTAYGRYEPKEAKWAETWNKESAACWAAAWATIQHSIFGETVCMNYAANNAAWCAIRAVVGDEARAEEAQWQYKRILWYLGEAV
jgi:hypothetical protein